MAQACIPSFPVTAPTAIVFLALFGCARPTPLTRDAVPQDASQHGDLFVADVDGPFEVRDPSGRTYHHAFLGGFNVPRPQLVDIDRDGDKDLFLQEQPDAVMYFENTGAASVSAASAGDAFVFRSPRYAGIDVGEWYRYVDLDEDGRPDLLTERKFSYVRYLQNRGESGNPTFVEIADTLKDVAGEPIFSDRQNIPNVADIDCDGNPDLFIGRLDGSITRYELAEVRNGIPRFAFVGDHFQGISIIGQILGSRHGANTLYFVDLDADGDPDILWGDYFEPGLLFIENTGSCRQVAFGAEPQPFPIGDPIKTSGYNAPAPGDVDGDGDTDLLVGVLGGAFNANSTTVNNLIYLQQTDEREYAVRTRRFIYTVDVGAESIAAVGDLDSDGDPDLLLSNEIEPSSTQTSGMYFFKMDEASGQRYWQLEDTLRFEPAYHYAPALGDLDADGDLDMILGTWRSELRWYRNESTGGELVLTPVEGVAATLTRGSNATPALVDIDADGDLDLFVGETSGTLNFYRNTGTSSAPLFELITDEYADIDVGRRSFPTFADLDGDGDYDLVLGRDARSLAVYRNDGTRMAAVFTPVGPGEAEGVLRQIGRLETPALATPVFVDLDGDGDTDILSGGEGGGVVFFRRR